MWYAIWFCIAFAGFVLFRIVAATAFFYFIIPQVDNCPHCDAHTLRVQSTGWNMLMPWFRTSWCYECGWEGLLRFPDPPRVQAVTWSASQAGQLPLKSKKSS